MARTTKLFDTGDITQEPGSKPWAVAVRLELWNYLDHTNIDHKGLSSCLDTFSKFEAWQSLTDANGNPFPDLPSFCNHPRPEGLGVSASQVREWLKAFSWAKSGQGFAADQEVKPSSSHGNKDGENNSLNRVYNVNSDIGGNNSQYLVRRLKRDHPEIAEALAKGKYPSARAAAIAAGIVKLNPFKDAQRAFKKLTAKDRKAFLAWLQEQGALTP